VIELVTIAAFCVLIFLLIPGKGKFWHKHDWKRTDQYVAKSIYFNDAEEIYDIYKCQRNCSAWKIKVDLVRS